MSTDRSGRDHSYPSESGLASEPAVVESLADATPIGLVVIGPDSTVQWVDESAARFFGLESGAGVGTERSQFLESSVLPCLDAPAEFPESETATEDGVDCHVLPSADRTERWLRYDSIPIATGDLAGGRLEQYVDVTGEQTRDRLEQYRSIAETTDDAVYVVNRDSAVEYATPAARELADCSLSAMTGQTLYSSLASLLPDEAATERLKGALETVFGTNSDDSVTVEFPLERSAGRQTYGFECRQTECGTRAIVTARDVSARRERERRYETLVENFPNGAVALVDEELRYTTVGGTPLDDADATVSELQGQSLEDALPSELAEMLVPRYVDALDGEQSVFEETVGTRTYRFRIVPVRNDDDKVFAAMGISQDITAERSREQELRELNQVLDVALEETGTGIWVLDYDDDNVTTVGTTTELHGLESGRHSVETYLEAIYPEDRRAAEDALRTAQKRGERFDIEYRVVTDEAERWVHSRGTVSDSESETGTRMLGVTTDITDRKHREHALEKQERVLNELHTATREFYPPKSTGDIGDFLVEFTENAFDVDYVSVKQYDEETGALESAVRSVSGIDTDRVLGSIEPGSNPIWESYRTGETRLFQGTEIERLWNEFDAAAAQLLVAPVGDFGVMTAVTTAQHGFDDVDVDLVDVLTSNAESAFQRLRTDKVHSTITDELSAQQSRITELNSIIDAVQAVQRRLADSDSQDALETGVCEELLEMDRVDFVWIGQPTGKDTDLSPAAWAGDADGYLDSVLADSVDLFLPAQRAADTHDVYEVSNISGRVFDESWAKDALSYGFKSVASVPLVYDDVLYGVLTVYSHSERAFDRIYETLLANVASLVVNYSRILEQRQAGTQQMHTELEFALGDETFPLQRLAIATDATLRFDTVAERGGDTIRILVTVIDGDAPTVLEQASSMTSIDTAEWFGAVEHDQLSLLLRKPFLESVVSKHGGKLLEAISDGDGTTVRVKLPATVSYRPILDSLTSQYDDIDLVAKHQRRKRAVPDMRRVEDLLTERQHEILNAAFYGGYYETPRRVKGKDLAESFGISGPAVYNHLQAAHRRLLEAVLEPAPETNE